jgi:ABC-type multidrug transport system ATPase subunit
MKGLKLSHLGFKIRDHALFTDLNAYFAMGKIIALAGANGCGKSTLLSILAGLNQPHHGEVLINGVDLYQTQEPPQIGYLPHLPNLYPYLTVEENLLWLTRLQRCQSSSDKVRTFMVKHQIMDFKNKLFGKLSDGQKKRINLLACIIHEPTLFILDEPCSLLDLKQRQDLWTLLANIRAPHRMILFSTHHVSEVTSLCDDIVLLHEGQLHFEKTKVPVDESIHSPA